MKKKLNLLLHASSKKKKKARPKFAILLLTQQKNLTYFKANFIVKNLIDNHL